MVLTSRSHFTSSMLQIWNIFKLEGVAVDPFFVATFHMIFHVGASSQVDFIGPAVFKNPSYELLTGPQKLKLITLAY